MSIAPMIRQGYREELDEIEGLVKEAYQEFRPLFPPDIWETWMANLTRAIHSEAGIQLVVEAESTLQGTIKFYPDAAQAGLGQWPQGSASMRVLAVRPGSRTRGYGRLLVAECLRRARKLGVSKIYLYTGRFMHAARHLYESMGFARDREFDRDPGPIAYHLDLGEEPKP